MISFLITHYNRPKQLKKCINAIRALNYNDFEIVVSDDFSNAEIINEIKDYPIHTLVTAKKNNGLAANINKGIKACKGEFILYCQEDFLLKQKLSAVLDECKVNILNGYCDMIRFNSRIAFKNLSKISDNISLIPKFSFANFLYNHNQYSDNPFITTKSFFTNYGFYLENTSGDYGETEYATRIFKSKAKIGLTNIYYVSYGQNSMSVIDRNKKNKRIITNKKIRRLARALRLYLEYFVYNKQQRGLLTYKNFRA